MRNASRTAVLCSLFAALAACGGGDGGKPHDTGGATDATSSTGQPDEATSPGDTTGENHAPELERIGDRVVAIGKTLVITLSAKDADNDTISYSVFGNLPAGSRFDKNEHRFEWSPTEAGLTVFLTFVASDGTDFDRETVRIQTTADATSSPPVFVAIGDQTVTPGSTVALTLVATDPDGDPITYGHDGALPEGATLDEHSGQFAWSVPSALTAGPPVRVTFTATDGSASASLVVSFIIDDGSAAVPKPPVLAPLPNVTAKVGQLVTFTLAATDANGDAISYSIKSGAPADATLSGATFSWTPTAAVVGQTFTITFAASDGTFSALTQCKITVTSGQAGACTPDGDEPNDTVEQAKTLSAGTKSAALCLPGDGDDVDLFQVVVGADQQLTVTLTFDAPDADLDLAVIDAAENVLAISDGIDASEQVVFAPTAAGTYYVAVYGYALEALDVSYTLVSALGERTACTDDDYEDNDTLGTATAYDEQVSDATLQVCAGDADYYRFGVQCGARVEVLMSIDDDADLDLYLYNDTSALDPIDEAITEDSLEGITVDAAPNAGTWVLEVSGYPFNTAQSAYDLLIDVTGGCQEDSRDNHTKATAATFSGLATGTTCCGDDWFKLTLQAGEKATVDLDSDNGLAVGATAYASNGTTQLGARQVSTTAGSFAFTAATAGTYYLKASGAVGAVYLIDVGITSGAATCDSKSCDIETVCDASDGTCVSDFCIGDPDCPSSYKCIETWCANTCSGDSDCRVGEGYACKEGASATGRYCGVSGTGGPGASCADHSNCQGQQVCLFPARNGYCAEATCAGCPSGTKCATVNGQSICAKTCNVSSDCRVSDGYTCSAEKTCLPNP